jgi:hypothetical protein
MLPHVVGDVTKASVYWLVGKIVWLKTAVSLMGALTVTEVGFVVPE